MNSLIEQVRGEHKDIAEILAIIESELNGLASSGEGDYTLLSDAMRYMTQYPDLFHHVNEDLIYRRLMERDRKARALVNALTEEHEYLRRLGLSFLEIVEDAADEVMVGRDELDSRGRAYLSAERAHMRREEDEVLPWVSRALSDEDWKEIEQDLKKRRMPHLNESAPERFRTLRAYIGGYK